MINRHIYTTVLLLLGICLPFASFAKEEEGTYTDQVMHHIADANEFHFWDDIHIPLPVIAWSKTDGLHLGMSSDFYSHDSAPANHDDHSGHGHDHSDHGAHAPAAHHGPTKVINGYFLDHGTLRRIKDASKHTNVTSYSKVITSTDDEGHEVSFIESNGKAFEIENASTLLGMTDWIDFSITKNVATLLMAMIIFALIFFTVASGYKKNKGKAPSGIQSFFEPLIIFVRDDIAKEMIGPKYEKYFPYLCTLFFFILVVNLLGLIPIAPFGSSTTGNISVTLALAVITFLVVNLSGNAHYWGHILWMPGVPTALKPLMAVIELIGVFVKPFTLMIRLFANITAGHIIILSLVGLIFLFGNNGANVGGASLGALVTVPFVFIMNILELFVAFLQAFIFTLLSALYIGAAVEEHHHDDHAHAHASSH